MALINDVTHAPSSLLHDLREAVRAAFTRMVQRRAYHVTLRVLSELSDRQLKDLGLSRSEIPARAYEAAYGKNA